MSRTNKIDPSPALKTVSPRIAPAMATSLALSLGAAATAQAADSAALVTDAADRDTIIVDGEKRERENLDRVLTPIIETPQAVSTLSREELVNRGINNLNDALRSVPGISLGAGETSYQGNNAILRGFTTRNDAFLDNIRDFGYYFRDTFNDEGIEVYKGPSSILFGRGSTGGVIHRVSKKPFEDNLYSLQLTGGFDDTRRAVADVNLADIAGEGTAFRINGVVHRSALESRDLGQSKRWGVAPSFSIGLGGPTTLTLSYIHQEEDNRPDYGIPWFPGAPAQPGFPAPVERATYYGFTNDYLDTNVDIITGRLAHEINEALTLRVRARVSDNQRRFRYSEAFIAAGTPQNTPLDTITVSRNLFEGYSTDRFFQIQSEVVSEFSTGVFHHDLITGVELGKESSAPVYVTNFNVPTTSLTMPTNPVFDSSLNQFVRLTADGKAGSVGLYGVDTIELGEKWRAIIGLRWDRFAADYESTGFNPDDSVNAVTLVDRSDKEFSYRGALVYNVTDEFSVYGAYGTSFNPSGEGIESFISSGRAVGQANINLPPETSNSAEFGVKVSLFDDQALLTASIFRIEKDNVRVPDENNTGFNTLGGRQRVDGFEIEFNGQITPAWNVHAGYSYLDSATIETTPRGPLLGEPLTITPKHSGSVSSWYDLSERLSFGVTAVGASRRLGQNTPTSFLEAPGFVIVDLGGVWQATDHLTFRVNVNNLFDKLYYDQLHPAHVIPGAGRTALGSLTITY